ncbi:hypothetical protein M5C72_04765 [Companilactobacillus allii]|uniref:ASCH domain-containing protein n=1 Tax=Companilactobacillus allii TaxID=1847728 RepID=A0A1P8Q3Q8_9LACO|nr:hypothetical protein [Companilactobacillus allii]APX72439.1 hypothetical protein BTM29_07700 [Companilactobacillus allii]USQ69535.1 hypothetical protein M5C72_04765 [Companilactobacillus allii]
MKLTEIYNPKLPIILLSLRSEYARKIILGEQTVEHRKRFLHTECQAIIYSSGEDKSISLFLNLGKPRTVEDGYEMSIISHTELANEISLDTVQRNFPKFKVPRSYIYLDKPDKADLLNYFLQQQVKAL